MAGIYIHFPFCKSRCYYCDFFSTTETEYTQPFLEALLYEISLRKNMIEEQTVETIYFGGGTPSLLNPDKIQLILENIYKNFKVTDHPEITIEVNPDDVTTFFIKKLTQTDINRISIGIQAFYNYHLQLMNRRHKTFGALKALQSLQDKGYDNISIDLIYGLPEMTLPEWEKTLHKTIKMNVQHISAYHLTYEKNTIFDKLRKNGTLNPTSDVLSFQQFEMMVDYLSERNFVHYEISNFGRLGRFSKHNVNYWKSSPYLGLGPSAHSYDGKNRYWNIPDLKNYLNIKKTFQTILQQEKLSKHNHFNEYIMTNLRTYWGIDIKHIQQKFQQTLAEHTINNITPYIDSGHIWQKNNKYYLTKKGMFISDSIIANLFAP